MWRRSCVVFVGGKAVPADRDFPVCAGAAGKGGSESERAGTANPVHKGHDGSDERDPKPPKREKERDSGRAKKPWLLGFGTKAKAKPKSQGFWTPYVCGSMANKILTKILT
ncbi:hypothetical protein B0H11DRAFT_1911495 [Mycena galericulata]|nr:hypothetical protein B0H11DRAFT_1911495 [Mycena galericulata]